MNKHAYLIISHGNWEILGKLLTLLNDNRNDIFLHVDIKTEMPEEYRYLVDESKFRIIKPQNVYWADFSMVEVILRLLSIAKKSGQYSYFHLMSGVDLPIKSKNEIYNFFENSGKEFIGIVPNEVYYSVRRVKYYHPFCHNKRYRNSIFLKIMDRIFEYIQKFFSVNRLKNNCWKIMDGWSWFSITNEFSTYVLENKSKIYSMFSNSIASDELFMQTLIYNSPYYNKIYDPKDLKKGSMRFIDWERGKPYTWEEEDFDELIGSPYMFARKFDERHIEIAQKIFNYINFKNELENKQ